MSPTPAPAPTPTPRDPAKDKELLKAAQNGDVSAVKKLLAGGADITCQDEEWAGTPLHWAAFKGHSKVVSLLLDKGADVNATNKDGRTALFMAAGFNHRQVVEILLRHKADRGIRDKNGRTALDWDERKKDRAIVKLLKK